MVIPVYNAEKTIDECVQSLLALDYPQDKLEIITVDNNSTDNTKEILLSYPIIYLLEKKKVSYAARNLGIRNAKGEIIAFTDSDCVVDAQWLSNIIPAFDNPRVGA